MKRFTKKQLIEKYGTPIGYRNGIPTFKAIKENEYSMKMFCPYCKVWHKHGIEKRLGHRVAHCGDQNSPFKATGYFIFLVDGEEK